MPESAAAPTKSISSSQSPRYLIDKILRANEVHLISGPSGSGTTTLMLQILSDWRQGNTVFGHPATPQPFAVISCGRSISALRDTMVRLELDPSTIPHFSIVDMRRDRYDTRAGESEFTLSEVMATAKETIPYLRILFMDGLSSLCGGKIIDHRDVRVFLQDATRLCIQHSVTILGTVYAPKSRDGEGYGSPRDRILGSGAWSAFTSTKIVIEPDDTKRTIHILPQNAPPESWDLMHDPLNGRLIPYVATGASAKLDTWLAALEPGALISTSQAVFYGELNNISKSTVEKWIKNQVSLGTLVKVDRGEYRVSGEAIKN